MRTQLARFPFVKGLDAFDFSYQPSLDKKQLQTLSTCHFIEHGENLVISSPRTARTFGRGSLPGAGLRRVRRPPRAPETGDLLGQVPGCPEPATAAGCQTDSR